MKTKAHHASPPALKPLESAWHQVKLAFTAALCLPLALLSAGCGGMDSPPSAIPGEAFNARPSGTLAAGDLIKVSYSGAPEMNLSQKIQPNGRVSLPLVGDVSAEGKSIASLQSQLTGLYQPHLQDSKVVVAVETAAAGVYVSGEVVKPGKIPLDRSMTALEAIMESGGFSKFANPKQVFVVRNEKGKQQRYVLNLSDTLNGYSNSAFYLRPYDVIYVKQSNW